MKKKISILFLLFICVITNAQIPCGYYSSLEGKKGAELKTALHDIICQDTTHYLRYGSGRNSIWQGFYFTDRDSLTNRVLDMYSDSTRFFSIDYITKGCPGFGSKIQIEHCVPKSWWGCDIQHPDCAARDLNHLYPADGYANNYKRDHPLGIVSSSGAFDNGVCKVGMTNSEEFKGVVFEPADRYKGDFARSYFYIVTAYEHYAKRWTNNSSANMMENNTYPELKSWAITLLLQWHQHDPVSQKERTRQEKIFAIQKNRNPFIDYPDLVEYIWGRKKNIVFHLAKDK